MDKTSRNFHQTTQSWYGVLIRYEIRHYEPIFIYLFLLRSTEKASKSKEKLNGKCDSTTAFRLSIIRVESYFFPLICSGVYSNREHV